MTNAMTQNLTNALAENRRAAKEDADLPQQRVSQHKKPTNSRAKKKAAGSTCAQRLPTNLFCGVFLGQFSENFIEIRPAHKGEHTSETTLAEAALDDCHSNLTVGTESHF